MCGQKNQKEDSGRVFALHFFAHITQFWNHATRRKSYPTKSTRPQAENLEAYATLAIDVLGFAGSNSAVEMRFARARCVAFVLDADDAIAHVVQFRRQFFQ